LITESSSTARPADSREAGPACDASADEDIAPVLVLGLGNLLLRDDGVGLELLRRLESLRPSAVDPRVEYLDGGTQGVALLGRLTGRSALLVLDAVSLGAPPGEVMTVRDPLEHPDGQHGGAHGANASGLLASAQLLGDLPPLTIVVGVSPAELATGIGLSEPVRRALPDAMATAEQVLAELCERAGDPSTRGALECTS
jgi:hydrogenase maturation protease